jgi:hypothetical protein
MKEENKNVADGGTLFVFCVDSVGLKDKTTFDSEVVDGIQVTYWADDEGNVEEKLKEMFNILFQDMLKNKDKSSI